MSDALLAWLAMYASPDIANGPPIEPHGLGNHTVFWITLLVTNFFLLRWCWRAGRELPTAEQQEQSARQESEQNQ